MFIRICMFGEGREKPHQLSVKCQRSVKFSQCDSGNSPKPSEFTSSFTCMRSLVFAWERSSNTRAWLQGQNALALVTACLTQQPALLSPSQHHSAPRISVDFSTDFNRRWVREQPWGQHSPEPYSGEMSTTWPLHSLAANPRYGVALVAATLGILLGAEMLTQSPQVRGRMGQVVSHWILATIAAVSVWNSPNSHF